MKLRDAYKHFFGYEIADMDDEGLNVALRSAPEELLKRRDGQPSSIPSLKDWFGDDNVLPPDALFVANGSPSETRADDPKDPLTSVSPADVVPNQASTNMNVE